MYATHYKPELADTIYEEVYFTVESDQFDDDVELTNEVDGRIHDLDEAKEQALKLADRLQQNVEVSVYGTWGFFGREFVESFTVKPATKPCPIQSLRADLAEISAQMFGA